VPTFAQVAAPAVVSAAAPYVTRHFATT
jgi:hypothetical protein